MSRWLMTTVAIAGLLVNSVASAELPADSPRRTRTVDIIERTGSSVVAIFAQGPDNKLSSGSGTVIHPRGYILTNDHVVQDRRGVVLYRNLPPIRFQTVGRMTEKDLALIRIEPPHPLVAAPLGRSHDLHAGEPILIGGNPGGRGVVFAAGIVSSPGVMLTAPSALAMSNFRGDTRDRFIQFDVSVNPGNSGGALLNAEGQQIGVVVGHNPQEQAISFAIPIDRARRHLRDLVLPEERGGFWTGIQMTGLGGATIHGVALDSPAAAAGFRPGDVITAMDNEPVGNEMDVLVSLVRRKPGDAVKVRLQRDDQPLEVILTLAEHRTPPGVPVAERKSGLNYRLYRGEFRNCPAFEKLPVDEAGTVDVLRLDAFPRLPDDNYALVLEGYLEIPDSGVWMLGIGSDDGSRLFLNGELVVDNDGPHPLQVNSGHRRLGRGLHPVRIEYFEATGDADLKVLLTRDGSSSSAPVKFYRDIQ